ncbi:MAG: holliday junction helicase RuvA [Thermosediminibacterales bacterium]|nr:holliday junction helicase RuvA [Thermosediminibacterales bacterium]
MIYYLKGYVKYTAEDFVIVEVNNIGYKLFLPSSSIKKLSQKDEELQFYTYLYHKEDSINLYGFLTQQELKLFEKMVSVSGLGPKTALAALSTYSPEKIYLFLIQEDVKSLMAIPGVGKKSAQRMVLELKDKFKAQENVILDQKENKNNVFEEVKDALLALGWSRKEAFEALQNIPLRPDTDVESVLKRVLQYLDKKE